MARHTRGLLGVVAIATLAAATAASAQAQELYMPVAGALVPQQPYQRFTTRDAHGRIITFYVSEEPDSETPLPLVVYVHGSGARSHFVEAAGGVRPQNGHATVADAVRGRARLVIVEKPGVAYGDSPGDAGGASQASAEFRQEHTLDRWAEAVHAAVQASRRLPGVDARRLLVIGHSEGGIVAARLAADHDMVTHVAVLAGGGPSQLYELLRLARDGVFFARVSADANERVNYVLQQWEAIQADPQNPDRMFFGHPYRRWSSFLQTSPIEQLLRTDAKIFVAQGTRDQAVPPESFEILRAELSARGKRGRFQPIEGADHNFVIEVDGRRVDGWRKIMDDIVAWFLDPDA